MGSRGGEGRKVAPTTSNQKKSGFKPTPKHPPNQQQGPACAAALEAISMDSETLSWSANWIALTNSAVLGTHAISVTPTKNSERPSVASTGDSESTSVSATSAKTTVDSSKMTTHLPPTPNHAG